MYPDDYDPYEDLTALDNPANEFWASSATSAVWIIISCALGVGYAAVTEFWYDVVI